MAPSRGLRFSGQLFFVYDREAVTTEEDAPENAIIYFCPSTASIESRISICGQLVGISNFLSTVLDFAPVLINLKSERVALFQSGQYTLALGSSSNEPESLLTRQLQALFDIFVFYHGSLETVRDMSKDHVSFLKNMSNIWDCYLSFIRHYGDTLPAVFDPIPFLTAPKNSSGCFLKASHILQTCQRRHHILGGCILYKKSVLCTQLETCITRRLLLLEPKQCHLPAKQVKTDIKLPYGVRILHSFVTCCEYGKLVTALQQSPYHLSKKDITSKQQQQQSPKQQPPPSPSPPSPQHTSNENTGLHKSALSIASKSGQKSELKKEFSLGKGISKCEILSESEMNQNYEEVLVDDGAAHKDRDCTDSVEQKPRETDIKSSKLYHDNNGVLDCPSTALADNILSHTYDQSLIYNYNDECEELSVGEEDLTMDEIDIQGLHIVKSNSDLRENGRLDVNEQAFSGTKNEKIPDSHADIVAICSELIESLIEQVSIACESTTGSVYNGSLSCDSNGVCLNGMDKSLSNGFPISISNECQEEDHTESTPVMENNFNSNSDSKADLSTGNSKMDIREQSVDSGKRNDIMPKSRPIYISGLHFHGNQPANTSLSPCETSPVEEYHDTVEDLVAADSVKTDKETVTAILQNYQHLNLHDLMVSKYSAFNLNRPENKTIEKDFFKDLIHEQNVPSITVVDTEAREQEFYGILRVPISCRSDENINEISDPPQDSAGPEENVRTIPTESGISQEENGRESGLSYSISSESPTCGGPVDCMTSLGDSGLCLFHGVSESSLHQVESSEPPNANTSKEGSVDMPVYVDMSTDTVDAPTEQKQEDQADYIDHMDYNLCQIDGLVHINLYVQAHSNIVLILLADSSLSMDQETIKVLWKTTLNELGDLEVHLNQCTEITKHTAKPDEYSFLVYEGINNTTKGNLSEPVHQVDHKFCETAKTVHEQFTNCRSLKAITLRDNSAAVHCQRSLGQEVYFHKKGPLKPFRGSPSLRDSAFSLEKRARKQLRKNHGINVF